MRRRRPPVDGEAERWLEMLRQQLRSAERLVAAHPAHRHGPPQKRVDFLFELIAEEEARGAQET